MAKLAIKRGSTSKLVRVFIQDSSQTDGRGLTGLAHNTGSLSAYYIEEGKASATAITLVTATVGTFTSSGFKEVDATNMPGVYELGIPNAALDEGNSTLVMLKGAANMVPCLLEIELDAYDPQSAHLGIGTATLSTAPSAGTWAEAMAAARASTMGKRSWDASGNEIIKAHDDSTTLVTHVIKDRAGSTLAAPATGQPTQRT